MAGPTINSGPGFDNTIARTRSASLTNRPTQGLADRAPQNPIPRDQGVDTQNCALAALKNLDAKEVTHELHIVAHMGEHVAEGVHGVAEHFGKANLAEHSHHVGDALGKASTGLGLLGGALSAVLIGRGEARIKAGEKAKNQLEEYAASLKSGRQVANEDGLEKLKANTEKVWTADTEKGKRIGRGIGVLKTVPSALSATHVTGHGSSAAGAAGAVGLVGPALMAVAGGLQIHKAVKAEKAVSGQITHIGAKASDGRYSTSVPKAIKEAADDVQASRAKHLSHAKTSGKWTVGLGVAGLAIGITSLVIAAPVVLPIASLALGIAGIAKGVHGLVGQIAEARSQSKIASSINAATKTVARTGVKMADDRIETLLDTIKSKNRERDRDRITKINSAAASMSTQIGKLRLYAPSGQAARGNQAPLQREMIAAAKEKMWEEEKGKLIVRITEYTKMSETDKSTIQGLLHQVNSNTEAEVLKGIKEQVINIALKNALFQV